MPTSKKMAQIGNQNNQKQLPFQKKLEVAERKMMGQVYSNALCTSLYPKPVDKLYIVFESKLQVDGGSDFEVQIWNFQTTEDDFHLKKTR